MAHDFTPLASGIRERPTRTLTTTSIASNVQNSIAGGRQEVTTADNPERLMQDSFIVLDVLIEPMTTNTGTMYVSVPNESLNGFAKSNAEAGYRLTTDRRLSFENIDLKDIWIDATVSGDGVIWGATIAKVE